MTNISITTLCNRDCSYCFARSVRSAAPGHMELQLFLQILEFLKRSGIGQVRLLGGEPTIHPHFHRFLDAIEERGLDLLLFTNGCIPEKSLQRLLLFPEKKLRVLVNFHHPDLQRRQEKRRVTQVCKQLHSRIIPGYNIQSPRFKPDFLLTLIRKFSLVPTIRLGIAHPCLEGSNQYLHSRYYEVVGKKVAHFIQSMSKNKITVALDCGFVPCMFTPNDLAMLHKNGIEPGKRCNPLPDLLPNGKCIACYPLATVLSVPITQERSHGKIQAFLTEKLLPFRSVGIFQECDTCQWRADGLCTGGCLAAAIGRMRHLSFTVDRGVQEKSRDAACTLVGRDRTTTDTNSGEGAQTPAGDSWAVPYIDQPLSFWEKIRRRFPEQLSEVYLPLPNNVLPSGRPPQKEDYLSEFLAQPPIPVSLLLNPVVLPEPVERIAPVVLAAIRRLHDETDISSVTVADYNLALRIKEELPHISLTASVLMDIARPHQAMLLNNIFDTLVPGSRILRDIKALKELREAFSGRIRLMVNEACLSDCLFRTQHFFEMACLENDSQSLCSFLLEKKPWLRLTGSWILPQHLHLYQAVTDEFKLAGRITLQDPEKFIHVLHCYINRKFLMPHEIGGGPASVLTPFQITERFFKKTLHCRKQCHICSFCEEYFNIGH